MANTTNLNLTKLAGTEKLKTFPTPYSDNMDTIDGAFGAGFGTNSKPSVNAEINSLADGLAIISNGNTHVAITSGQFVYVRNHSSLANGLYTATANISANGTLSGNNLTADAKGGLNALNSKMDGMPVFKTATLSDSGTTFTVQSGSRIIIETVTSAEGRCGVFYIYSSGTGVVYCWKLGAAAITVDVSQANKLTLTGAAGAYIRVYQGDIS